MRVRTIAAPQAHYVPDKAYYQTNPFEQGIRNPAPISIEENPVPEGDEPYPWGATVLNGMNGEMLFQCNDCGNIVPQRGLDQHICEE